MGARPEFWQHQLIPLATSTLGLVLIAWGTFLVLLVGGLALLVPRRNGEWSKVRADEWLGDRDRRSREDRRTRSDRRSGRRDRRVGLPDLRADKTERRRGPAERRSGRDRRSRVQRRGAGRLQAG
jgi:hypothetical protein